MKLAALNPLKWLLAFCMQPIWRYPIRDIARCVREDSDCVGTRAEHAAILLHFYDCSDSDPFETLTKRQRYILATLHDRRFPSA
jgi:hypothetical protein